MRRSPSSTSRPFVSIVSRTTPFKAIPKYISPLRGDKDGLAGSSVRQYLAICGFGNNECPRGLSFECFRNKVQQYCVPSPTTPKSCALSDCASFRISFSGNGCPDQV